MQFLKYFRSNASFSLQNVDVFRQIFQNYVLLATLSTKFKKQQIKHTFEGSRVTVTKTFFTILSLFSAGTERKKSFCGLWMFFVLKLMIRFSDMFLCNSEKLEIIRLGEKLCNFISACSNAALKKRLIVSKGN